jgi:Ca2+-transporting ATPase
VVGLAVLSALPLPLLPLQILYLNLVTDVFPAFALAMGEGEAEILSRPPRDPKEPILGYGQWIAILLHGVALTAGTFAALACARLLAVDESHTVTVTFLTLAFAQLWHVFNMHSRRSSVFVNEVTQNRWIWAALALCTMLLVAPILLPPFAELLELVPPTPVMWAIVLGGSLMPLVVTQAVTVLLRR